eukprot:3108583-Rhodomonas_salina.1
MHLTYGGTLCHCRVAGSYVLSDNHEGATQYVLDNGLVRYNLLKHQYRLIRVGALRAAAPWAATDP